MLLISVPAIAAGILAKRLPETKDALLPETLEDAMMLDFRFAHKITHFSRRTFRGSLCPVGKNKSDIFWKFERYQMVKHCEQRCLNSGEVHPAKVKLASKLEDTPRSAKTLIPRMKILK